MSKSIEAQASESAYMQALTEYATARADYYNAFTTHYREPTKSNYNEKHRCLQVYSKAGSNLIRLRREFLSIAFGDNNYRTL